MHTARSLLYTEILCPVGVSVRRGLGPSDRDPLPLWTEWQTRVKTLPCPKLRLRALIIDAQCKRALTELVVSGTQCINVLLPIHCR